jgi:ribonuclease E
MPNKMLIDASHPEETRVVVVRGNRIEEFDFESQDKKQLKGNIYLARVTRVEPSLQAAFVEYGGNRHGFLAFSEIHPDYYQIPVADRQALLRAEAEAAESEDEDEAEGEERGERSRGRRRRRGGRDRHERVAAAADSESEQARSEDEPEEAGSDRPDLEAGDADRAEAEAADDQTDGPLSANTDETFSDGTPEEPTSLESLSWVEASSVSVDAGDDDVVSSGEATPPDATADKVDTAAPAEGKAPSEASPTKDEGAEDTRETKPNRPTSIAAAVDADVVSQAVEDVKEPETAGESPAADSEAAALAEDDRGGSVEEVPAGNTDESEVESVGAEDALEEVRSRRRPVRRNYKIQEVIKRRQILLVQVVKEERGNKGAALTTYLSLAGRYSVLMPNTARGGGISRKITNAQDRKRLKEVVAELDVPEGMGVILRTAGESRTKAEIKRDYEYLLRLWENVRNLTLQSTAPALVYEEGSLIKRSVRDLYNKDIDEILVAGEDGYREAKDFMRMLMPSHAKVVQPYRDTVPIFARSGIEAQLDRMLQPQVTLRSGGYIIINQTEALVSIDVNSGRSTKEHSIEDTALQTNLEAADEIARQLRLRDLAGLVVIDFIDMEENRNNRAVEKRLKDCLKNDRARIQVGRISHFGLLEMSRQRIRASVLESTMKPCPHCGGTGHVRSDSSVALHVVRGIEEFLLRDSRNHITVRTPALTALYVLNHKRSTLVEMERRFGVTITLEADETLGAQPYVIVRGAVAEKPASTQETQLPAPQTPAPAWEEEEIELDSVDEVEAEPTERAAHEGDGQDDHQNRDRKRRRRRRRRGGREHGDHADHDAHTAETESEAGASDDRDTETGDERADVEVAGDHPQAAADGPEGGHQKKRRRGKRGGRRNRPGESGDEALAAGSAGDEAAGTADEAEPEGGADQAIEPTTSEPQQAAEAIGEEASEPAPAFEPAEASQPAVADSEEQQDDAHQHRTRRRPGSENEPPAEPVVVSSAAEERKPKKGGWWQRKGFF